MSQENVELLRRGYAAFNRGDIDGLVTALAAPNCEFITAGRLPGVEDVYRGPEGFRRFVSFFWETFDDAQVEVHELIDAGDQVLATVTNTGRGKQSGADVHWTTWVVWTIRAGKVVRGQDFRSREEALEAVGLSE